VRIAPTEVHRMTPRVDDRAVIAVESDPDVVHMVRVRLDEGNDPIVEREIGRPVVVDAYLVTDS
jgi:hypothetical protein